MTLRVTFEIVPHGVEEDAYKIGMLFIHNRTSSVMGHASYGGTMELYDFLNVGDDEGIEFEGVEHLRQDGFMTLVRKVLEKLE